MFGLIIVGLYIKGQIKIILFGTMNSSPNNQNDKLQLSKEKVAQIFRSDQGLHTQNHLQNPQKQIHQNNSVLQERQLPEIQHSNLLSPTQQTIHRLNYNQQTKSDFSILYQNSLLFSSRNYTNPHPIPLHLINFITNLQAFRQNKVYNLVLGDAQSFLSDYVHLKSLNPNSNPNSKQNLSVQANYQINFAQMNVKISQNCADKVFSKVQNQILTGQFSNIFYRKNNLNEVKQQLQQNLTNLRKSLTKDSLLLPNRQVLAYQNGQQRIKKRNQMYFHYLASRKRQTWEDQFKSKEISEFLHKLHLERSLTHDRYNKSLQKKQRKQKMYQQKAQQLKLLQVKKNVDRQLQKHRQFKEQLNSSQKLNQQKSMLIADFLSKYQKQKPIYEKLDQSFKKKQKQWNEEDRKVLESIHEQRRVISLSELQKHSKVTSQRLKYKKQIMIENLNEVKRSQRQMIQKLNSLFHAKFHKSINEEKKIVQIDENKLRKEKARKSLSYSMEVVAKNHKPLIDPLKKMEIESLIEQEIKSYESMPKTIKIKRKIHKSSSFNQTDKQNSKDAISKKSVNTETNSHNEIKGQSMNESRKIESSKDIQEQEVQIEVDPLKIGKEYLKQLRVLNEGKPRKKIVQKKKQISSERKIFDYSKQKKDHFKINLTLSQWKKVLERGNVTEKVSDRIPVKLKEELLAPYIKRIEVDKGFYEGEIKKMDHNDTGRVLSLNRKLQKCYIESIRSKIQILKD